MSHSLSISNLHVTIDQSKVLNGLSLAVQPGTVHAIMGPNGSGKSSLTFAVAGHPSYVIEQGTITALGQEINALTPDKRAQLGIFLAFQHPLEIPGVTVFNFLKESYYALHNTHVSVADFTDMLNKALQQVNLDSSFAQRSLNDGFSGGEKKRLEIVQMLVLKPQLVILDEIDSGLDIDSLKLAAHAINTMRKDNPRMSLIVITHYQRVLEYIVPDFVHVLSSGVIVKSGDATLAAQLEQSGYDGL